MADAQVGVQVDGVAGNVDSYNITLPVAGKYLCLLTAGAPTLFGIWRGPDPYKNGVLRVCGINSVGLTTFQAGTHNILVGAPVGMGKPLDQPTTASYSFMFRRRDTSWKGLFGLKDEWLARTRKSTC